MATNNQTSNNQAPNGQAPNSQPQLPTRITGTNKNDVLTGDNSNNNIFGLAGNDKLFGLAGNDVLDGGDGNDLISGGDGSDFLIGGNGNDLMSGGNGMDLLAGDEGNDTLLGDNDNDILLGGSGNDSLFGGNGIDVLFGDAGNDTILGGNDPDVLDGGDGNDRLLGEQGNDVIRGGDGNDTLEGGSGTDLLQGEAGDDSLNGGTDSDRLEGGDGSDLLRGRDGNDILDGGNGNDFVDGDNGDDILNGGTGNDAMRGGTGNDLLDGDAGNDAILGEAGSDRIRGGAGDDVLGGDAALTLLALTDQNTLVSIEPSDPRNVKTIPVTGVDGKLIGIDLRPANGLIYGLTDTNKIYTIDLTGAATFVSNLSNPFQGGKFTGIDFNPVPDRLRLVDAHDNNLRVNVDTGAVAALVPGTPGDRPLAYAPGDVNFGKNPNITAAAYTNSVRPSPNPMGVTTLYVIDTKLNTLVRQGGLNSTPPSPNDGQLFTIGSLGVDVDDQTSFDIFSGPNGINIGVAVSNSKMYLINLETGAARDLGTVGNGSFKFLGFTQLLDQSAVGDDFISGGNGNDFIDGGKGNDILDGEAGNDFISGGDGMDAIRGRDGNDVLDGGGGNDAILGEAGDDTLVGGAGDDGLSGDAALKILGLSKQNQLVSINPTDPSQIQTLQITGVEGKLIGIDMRPADMKLYVVSDTNKIYTVDGNTGAATLVGQITPGFNGGQQSGFDFNPVPDRLRLVGSNDQNYRVNVATGAAIVDTNVFFDDTPNARGFNPNITAIAYTNSFAGATQTTLYGIDSERDLLVTQGGINGNPSPNAGQLFGVGNLGVDFKNVGGFDILSSPNGFNMALAASDSSLYTINLATGEATSLGVIGDGSVELVGLAIALDQTVTGNDVFSGGIGNDTLDGGNGNDILNGGAGDDVLIGGAGNDSFVYDTGTPFRQADVGYDTIIGFATGDKIVLDKTTFTALQSAAGNGFSAANDFAIVANDSLAGASTAFIVYSTATGNLFYNQDGARIDFETATPFTKLTGMPTLSANDFVVQA